MPTYSRLAVTFEKGRGVWLWDNEGQRYLDALAGIAVCGLGHAHSAVRDAIADQADRLIHTSNLYRIDLQEQLADRLIDLSGLENVFFCNSGAEANEAAIKIARAYGHQRSIENPIIIVTEGSFHGRTLATLTATANQATRDIFAPLVPGFKRIAYNDSETLKSMQNNPDIVAIMVEPIQGEGGVNVPAEGYLKSLRAICDNNNWLLILDEVQTGMGRTGRWFAYQHAGIVPDVCTLAKALGNGVPIGACLAQGEAAKQLTSGKHGSTFGGNPLACRAAIAVLDTLENDNLIENAAKMGEYLLERLSDSLINHENVKEIRGQGLMIGIEMKEPCGGLVLQALNKKVLINVTAGNTIRLLPPLIIQKKEADLLVDVLLEIIN